MEKGIDFVITWVNDKDTEWRKKKNIILEKSGMPMEKSADNERFRDYGTLKYLLRSIEKYASWVHEIYLITDNQKPGWMKDDLEGTRLNIVDHQDIIPHQALPTYNSNAIEFNIDNISGLSENFVEFNDDLLINKVVSPEDFFKDGKPRDFRLYKALIPNSPFDRLLFNDSYALNSWIKGLKNSWPINKYGIFSSQYPLRSNIRNLYFRADSHGRISNYVLSHNALSFKKSTFEKGKRIWNEEIISTILHHFRSETDVTIYLLREYQLETGNFISRAPSFSKYFELSDYKAITDELQRQRASLLCINDADIVDYDSITKKLRESLEKKFPKKSRFEK
ncbi:MAG TPA: Stealth CR1 domain-containing protein [Ligilactobacillus acidipiscis]|uniref:Stealth CR1 domain-containing protein n=1 Tax=Ligilactobacillus acidipiscis TaxID=89059 RepID=A0A921F630_9LACO|nr:Stealth CR1 domain-containing protein [Ligilactobacillus acidipiscis]